jgi:hypothetical protein
MSINLVNKLCDIFKSSLIFEKEQNSIEKYVGDNDIAPVLSLMQYLSIYCLKNNIGDLKLSQNILDMLKKKVLDPFKGTITITFGDVAETHVGMKKIGQMSKVGFDYEDLVRAQTFFKENGCDTFIIHLNDFLPKECEDPEEQIYLDIAKTDPKFQAWILVVRNGIKCLTKDIPNDTLLTELLLFKWDDKYYNERKGVIQNKNARHNLNFSEKGENADLSKGIGTVIEYNNVPILSKLRKRIKKVFGEKANNLNAEGNLYYKKDKTGIGYHGDTERRKVIACRLGGSIPIAWNWYYNDMPRGKNIRVMLNSGDVYCMSEKSVGMDWRPNVKQNIRKKRYVLRHAAGASSYLKSNSNPLKSDKLWVRNQRIDDNNPDITIGDVFFKENKKDEWDKGM